MKTVKMVVKDTLKIEEQQQVKGGKRGTDRMKTITVRHSRFA